MAHVNTLADNAVAAAHLAVCDAVGKTGREMRLYELHTTAAERCEAAAKDKTNQKWVRDEFAAMANEMTEAADAYLARA